MYDFDGNILWTDQFGSNKSEYIQTSSIDTFNGNILVAGSTEGFLEGTSAGVTDAFMKMYDSDGNELWTNQFGTTGLDIIRTSSIDPSTGNILVAGESQGNLTGTNAGDGDAFLRMYDSDGNILWTDQFGTSEYDWIYTSAIDPSTGNILVAGPTLGDIEGTNAGYYDAFLRMYDSDGNILWTEQFGTRDLDYIITSSLDPSNGNVLVAGITTGNLDGTNVGNADGFLRMYDSNGNELWATQFGTNRNESIYTSSINPSNGSILVAGSTQGSLWGTNAGYYDGFLRMYDSSGSELWTKQFGTSDYESIETSSIDPSNGNIIVAGNTKGDLEGISAGYYDAFVRVYTPLESFNFDDNITDLFSDYIQGNFAPTDHQVLPLCKLQKSNYNIIKGTQFDDELFGTNGDDMIFGYAGDDFISGEGGNDCIYGGDDDDIIEDTQGTNLINGGRGSDTCLINAESEYTTTNCESLE